MWFGETKKNIFSLPKDLVIFYSGKRCYPSAIYTYIFISFLLFKWKNCLTPSKANHGICSLVPNSFWSLDKLFSFSFFSFARKFQIVLFCFIATPQGIGDLKYSTRHQTRAPCIGSMGSHLQTTREVRPIVVLIPSLLLSHFLFNPLHSFFYYCYVSEILVIKVSNT